MVHQLVLELEQQRGMVQLLQLVLELEQDMAYQPALVDQLAQGQVLQHQQAPGEGNRPGEGNQLALGDQLELALDVVLVQVLGKSERMVERIVERMAWPMVPGTG